MTDDHEDIPMRVLVCGGRDYSDFEHLSEVLDRHYRVRPFSHLIHGGAAGADLLADTWASDNHVLRVPFFAEWDVFGKSAGPIRNGRMLEEGKPDLVLAFAGGRGTADMIRKAEASGVPVQRC
jgi:hypothetical protein